MVTVSSNSNDWTLGQQLLNCPVSTPAEGLECDLTLRDGFVHAVKLTGELIDRVQTKMPLSCICRRSRMQVSTTEQTVDAWKLGGSVRTEFAH